MLTTGSNSQNRPNCGLSQRMRAKVAQSTYDFYTSWICRRAMGRLKITPKKRGCHRETRRVVLHASTGPKHLFATGWHGARTTQRSGTASRREEQRRRLGPRHVDAAGGGAAASSWPRHACSVAGARSRGRELGRAAAVCATRRSDAAPAAAERAYGEERARYRRAQRERAGGLWCAGRARGYIRPEGAESPPSTEVGRRVGRAMAAVTVARRGCRRLHARAVTREETSGTWWWRRASSSSKRCVFDLDRVEPPSTTSFLGVSQDAPKKAKL